MLPIYASSIIDFENLTIDGITVAGQIKLARYTYMPGTYAQTFSDLIQALIRVWDWDLDISRNFGDILSELFCSKFTGAGHCGIFTFIHRIQPESCD